MKKIMPLILTLLTSEVLNKTTRTDIFKIDPRNIYVPTFGEGFHFRNENNYGDMDELMASIKENGVVTPLEVKRIKPSPENGNKEFEVVFGFRRMEAVLRLLAQDVEVPYVTSIVSSGNDEDRLFKLFASDTSQVHLNVVEQAEAVRQLHDVKNYSQQQIHVRIGKSIAFVYNLLALSRLPKKVKDQITEGGISTNAVLTIMRTVTDSETIGDVIKDTIKNAQRKATNGKVRKATAADVTVATAKTVKQNPFDKLKAVAETLKSEGVKNSKTKLLDSLVATAQKGSVEDLTELFK